MLIIRQFLQMKNISVALRYKGTILVVLFVSYCKYKSEKEKKGLKFEYKTIFVES